MILEIVTPEAKLVHSEVDSVVVPGINGEFQMLNNHAPVVSILVRGELKFKGEDITIEEEMKSYFTVDKGEYKLAINSGTVEIKGNKIIILSD